MRNSETYRKFHGVYVESDWERLRALRQICDQVEGVSTPLALSVDAADQSILYEYATFPIPLVERVDDGKIFSSLGRLLARMHQASFSIELGHFSDNPYPLDTFGMSADELALLQAVIPVGWFHSDFWHGNVFFGTDMVIIDPLPARRWLFEDRYIRASGALDLASMYMSLLLCHPLHKQVWLDIDPYIHAGDMLLEGYLSEVAVDSDVARRTIRKLSRIVGLKFVDGYARRLARPLALVKRKVALKILHRVDEKIHWECI